MTTLEPAKTLARQRQPKARLGAGQNQRGVVLVIALILMLVISVLAVTSMRNVASTERVSGNVRTTELATQAADIALRHCEASVTKHMSGAVLVPFDMPVTEIRPAGTNAWQNLPNWDGSAPANPSFRLDLELLNLPSITPTTFNRTSECMVELLAGTVGSAPASFIITARGFGPEVRTAAGAGRPAGTVVWLQSTLDFQ
jgi:type IV pilus assembly protein PilX